LPVKIVTDSTSDIPPELSTLLGIEVVPVHIHFGKETYRDGIDLTPTEFYQKLESNENHPVTSQPSIGDFVNVYRDLFNKGATSIVSIHISSKISGTFSSAKRAAELIKDDFAVDVIDSRFNSIGLGLICIAAAKLAMAVESLNKVSDATKNIINRTDMFGIFDTLKYVVRGGRISKTKATVASIIGVKPMLKFSDGSIFQSNLVRTYTKGIEKLVEFVKNKRNLVNLAIAHSAVPVNTEVKKASASYSMARRLHTELGPCPGISWGSWSLLVAHQR
jgi:DegV family protein with EDD domain